MEEERNTGRSTGGFWSALRRRNAALAGALLAGVLLVSVGANVFLFDELIDQYRSEQQLRLDPTSAARFEPANRQLAPLAEGEGRVVLFGDSRIQQWSSFPKPKGCQVVNRGRGDETTAQGLLRMDRDVLALAPDLVVIQFGINDLKGIGVLPGKAKWIEQRCLANLCFMVETLRDARIDVLLLTIFPVGRPSPSRYPVWSDQTIDAVDRVNRELLKLAGPGVTVLDCDPLLRGDRRIHPEFAIDHLHLNQVGYDELNLVILSHLPKRSSEDGAN